MAESTKTTKEQIIASSLSVTYYPGQSNEVKSLDNINFSIYEGEFIIFFGPSGCGKSTMLYSIANLEKFSGDLVVEGKKVNNLSRDEKVNYHRECIGLVFQAYHLIPTLSVVQNVALPLISMGVKSSERIKRSMELLARFGVDKQANKLPNELSGGQQQRVAICRAVVNNPKILLADEPLGNLDSKSADEVIHLFKDINVRLGKTVILVTHDPTYLSIANRVFHIKDGKLINITVNETITESNKPDAAPLAPLAAPRPISKAPIAVTSERSREIAALALTGFTAKEIEDLKSRIEHSINHQDGFESVQEFLDVDPNLGGLGLDVRTANKITERIRLLSREYRSVADNNEEVFRRALFKELDIQLKHPQNYIIADRMIQARMRGQITKSQLFFGLHNPFNQGGADIDKRDANKIVKHLELMITNQKA